MIDRPAETDPPRMLDVIEAAGILNVCEKTVRNLVKRKELPNVRIGRRLLFRPASLEAWLIEREA